MPVLQPVNRLVVPEVLDWNNYGKGGEIGGHNIGGNGNVIPSTR